MKDRPLHRCSILVIHSDPLLCVGLKAILAELDGFDVHFGHAEALAPEAPSIDVVIAEYADALRLASATIRSMHRPLATARILALTSVDREEDIRRAIEAGVQGYLLQGSSIRELVEGITHVAQGAHHLSPSVARLMADSMSRAPLTPREIGVLRLVARGEPNKRIARALQIQVGTVKAHMTAIMAKLGALSRTHAAAIATARGLTSSAGEWPVRRRQAPNESQHLTDGAARRGHGIGAMPASRRPAPRGPA